MFVDLHAWKAYVSPLLNFCQRSARQILNSWTSAAMNGVRGTDLLNPSVPSNILRCIEDLFRFFIPSGSKWKHPPFGVSTEQYSGKHRSRTCVSIQRKGFHFKAWRFKAVFWGFVSAMFHHCTPKSPTGRPCFILTALWRSREPGDLPGISERNQLLWKKSPVSLQKWWVSPGELNFDIFESMLIPLRYKPLLSVGIKIRSSWCGLELELRINHPSCWRWLS